MNTSILALPVLALLGCGSNSSVADQDASTTEDGLTDHPPALCEDSRTHLRGNLDDVDIAADLCDFQYALVEHDPWVNWTKFGDGLIFLAGEENIFKAQAPTLQAQVGLIRMPSVSATAGQVYCGVGSYYEAPDNSAPDAEMKLEVSGFAGTCGGSGEGTLSLTSTFKDANLATFDVNGETTTRAVGGAYSDGEEFAFMVDNGFVDIFVATPLPDDASGEAAITSVTIALRDGSNMLLSCSDSSGTLKQTHTDLGLEFEVQVTGLGSWIDCLEAEAAAGSLTVIHDPRPE